VSWIAGPKDPRKLSNDEREALRLLAGSPHGLRESMMLAYGCATGVLRDLVRDGLIFEERRSMIVARPRQDRHLAENQRGRRAGTRTIVMACKGAERLFQTPC
jgi:hypothetical protein